MAEFPGMLSQDFPGCCLRLEASPQTAGILEAENFNFFVPFSTESSKFSAAQDANLRLPPFPTKRNSRLPQAAPNVTSAVPPAHSQNPSLSQAQEQGSLWKNSPSQPRAQNLLVPASFSSWDAANPWLS